MTRILVAECMQEVSTFNPVSSVYEDFLIHEGTDIFSYHASIESEVRGAMEVFAERSDVELVPTFSARAITSGGLLDASGFAKVAKGFLSAIEKSANSIDGAFISLHGAMSSDDELDPEGYLLEESRKILGDSIPIVVSLDLHGILTERMLSHVDAVTMLHTYPHIDFVDNGKRAARLLLKILDGDAKPCIARAKIPALVRGNELITETGVYGDFVRHAQKLEREGKALSAGFMIGNPFTDVPELCSQPVIVTNGDTELAEREATKLAEEFWTKRAQMQPEFANLDSAIEEAKTIDGPVIFTDAADATSSGASGDSNAILHGLLSHGYEKTVLYPLVDPPAVARAFEAGVGSVITTPLGGALDRAADSGRFTPVELKVTVDMLSRGEVYFESWNNWFDAGNTAVLKTATMTFVVCTKPIHLFDRSLFLAHGQDPERFDLTVVKSPHCQHRFFDAWAAKNFNIDAPGSTSANLKTLGHTICQRPTYPLDDGVTFTPNVDLFQK